MAVTKLTKMISPSVIESISVAIIESMSDSREKFHEVVDQSSLNLDFPVVVGLGGNIGATLEIFSQVLGDFRQKFTVAAISELYRSAPIGPDQADFLNGALLLNFEGDLEALLVQLHELEAKYRRVREFRWGPRTLDLDILWAGERMHQSCTLVVPHRELLQRSFALLPLLDLVPAAIDPQLGIPYRAIAEELKCQRIERISAIAWSKAMQ